MTIGNFDGVHLGHAVVLDQLTRLATRHGVPSLLLTFEPHPREFFSERHAPTRLTRLREKLVALTATPLDRVLLVRFDESFSSLSPADFVQRLLVDRLGATGVVVGDDFHFGYRAEGNFDLLVELGQQHGFEVVRQTTLEVGGARVSSSRVRDALAHGDLRLAAELLGRPYCMCGRVERGDERGRTLGFATANLPLGRVATPLVGVFAVKVHGLEAHPLPGMANLGTRPTVDGRRTILEVHLFDFDRDIYGRELRVEFVHRLRDEQRFDGLPALKAQLESDEREARRILETGALN